MIPEVQLVDLTKRFGTVTAVDGVSLDIQQGEFISLLGPSGCGKTTTLRMIAGLEMQASGQIYIRGREVSQVPPYDRNIGMVFQDYAVFPHMTINDNVGFGLRRHGVRKEEAQARAQEMLELVRLPEMGARRPSQLSGGERQRVALARALAYKPTVLLLDEPLSNLDLKLRQEMRVELKRIQREVGITTIFVTHDQGEALSLSDRVAVMRAGRIEQIGEPVELYERPQTGFVASFLGDGNFFRGPVQAGRLVLGEVELATPELDLYEGRQVTALIRSERAALSTQPVTGPNQAAGTVDAFIYLGSLGRYYVRLNIGQTMIVDAVTPGRNLYPEGTSVTVHWLADDCVVLKEGPNA